MFLSGRHMRTNGKLRKFPTQPALELGRQRANCERHRFLSSPALPSYAGRLSGGRVREALEDHWGYARIK